MIQLDSLDSIHFQALTVRLVLQFALRWMSSRTSRFEEPMVVVWSFRLVLVSLFKFVYLNSLLFQWPSAAVFNATDPRSIRLGSDYPGKSFCRKIRRRSASSTFRFARWIPWIRSRWTCALWSATLVGVASWLPMDGQCFCRSSSESLPAVQTRDQETIDRSSQLLDR